MSTNNDMDAATTTGVMTIFLRTFKLKLKINATNHTMHLYFQTGLWKSVHIDELRPSTYGQVSFDDLRKKTMRQLMEDALIGLEEVSTCFCLEFLCPRPVRSAGGI